MTKEIEEKVKAWYKNWCKETGRSGGVLIGSSIRELLQSFAEQKYAYDNDVYAGDGRVIEAERKAFISGLEQPLSDLLTPPADVQERAKEYAGGKVDLTVRGEVVTDIGNIHADVHSALNNGYLAGASSLQAENERLREILKKVAHYNDGKKPYDYHKRTDQEQAKNDSFDDWQNIRTEINEALNKQ